MTTQPGVHPPARAGHGINLAVAVLVYLAVAFVELVLLLVGLGETLGPLVGFVWTLCVIAVSPIALRMMVAVRREPSRVWRVATRWWLLSLVAPLVLVRMLMRVAEGPVRRLLADHLSPLPAEQRRRWPMLVATLAAHLGFALVWLLVFSITVLLYVSDEAFDKGETALYVVLLTVAASWVLALALTVWVWLQGRNAWAIPIGWLGLACTTSLIAVGVIAGAAV